MENYIGRQLGNYHLRSVLGRGSFAIVYLGEQIYIHTSAAIKVSFVKIESSKEVDFFEEARTISKLEHPHIVRIRDCGIENNTPFIVMDFAHNGSLRQRCATGESLPPKIIATYVKQVAEALQYAHNHKVIHRDVKPENMLLDLNDIVLLSDFGIAAIQSASGKLPTQPAVGTPAYVAPEQIQGHPSPASDQYSLAVVVYEWLCGLPPFTGGLYEVLQQHIIKQPPALREKGKHPNISPRIEQVVRKALAKDPHLRYDTVQDFAQAFTEAVEKAVEEEVAPTSPLPPPAPAKSPPRIPANPLQQRATQPQRPVPFIASPPAAPRAKSAKPARRKSPVSWYVAVVMIFILLASGSTLYFLFVYASTPDVVMLGYNPQHTRVDPVQEGITTGNVGKLGVKWKMLAGGTIGSAPTVANGIVYMSASGNPHDPGNFYAIDAKARAVIWMNPTMNGRKIKIGSNDDGNAPTVDVTNNVVYIGAPDNYLYALNAKTGNVIWRGPTGGRIGSSPTLSNGVIYIGSDDGYLYAFKADGCDSTKCNPLWHYKTGGQIRSSPAVSTDGKTIYIGSDDGSLYAIDNSGHKSWTYSTNGKVRSTPTVSTDGTIYVGSDDHSLYAINPGGSLAWKSYQTGGYIESSPALYNGVVYVGSDDGYLYAYDAGGCGRQSCTYLSKKKPGSSSRPLPIKSSPTIADNLLFIGSDDGYLYAFDITHCGSTSCNPVYSWSNLTSGPVDSSPVVANGYVYVGSNDKNSSDNGYLYAFGIGGS